MTRTDKSVCPTLLCYSLSDGVASGLGREKMIRGETLKVALDALRANRLRGLATGGGATLSRAAAFLGSGAGAGGRSGVVVAAAIRLCAGAAAGGVAGLSGLQAVTARTRARAGNSSPARMAMIAITTKSSMRVKARSRLEVVEGSMGCMRIQAGGTT